jgi:ABC-type glycerol-3-phosphate transport system permease component
MAEETITEAIMPDLETAGSKVGIARRKRIMMAIVIPFLALYALVTLFPFYVLFVRTFVGTKDAADLHLWPPPAEPVHLDADIGNMSIFYNLDLAEFKEDFGIPLTEYIPARMTLKQIAEKYDIPEAEFENYFGRFSRFNGWIILLEEGKIWASMGRSALVTVVSLVLLNILSICTGYGLAGLRRRDQMFVYNLFLLQMVIPAMLVIIPQFRLQQWLLKLIPGSENPGFARYAGQLFLLTLINIKGGAASTMLFTSAIGAIPRDIEESALIDGATRWQYFRNILLPLMKVPVASMTVMSLPWFWNQFLEAYVYLDMENSTLLPLIQNYSGQYTTNYQVVYTAIFVSVIPLVVLYILFRRWFIEGVMAGAVKG